MSVTGAAAPYRHSLREFAGRSPVLAALAAGGFAFCASGLAIKVMQAAHVLPSIAASPHDGTQDGGGSLVVTPGLEARNAPAAAGTPANGSAVAPGSSGGVGSSGGNGQGQHARPPFRASPSERAREQVYQWVRDGKAKLASSEDMSRVMPEYYARGSSDFNRADEIIRRVYGDARDAGASQFTVTMHDGSKVQGLFLDEGLARQFGGHAADPQRYYAVRAAREGTLSGSGGRYGQSASPQYQRQMMRPAQFIGRAVFAPRMGGFGGFHGGGRR